MPAIESLQGLDNCLWYREDHEHLMQENGPKVTHQSLVIGFRFSYPIIIFLHASLREALVLVGDGLKDLQEGEQFGNSAQA